MTRHADKDVGLLHFTKVSYLCDAMEKLIEQFEDTRPCPICNDILCDTNGYECRK